MKPTRFLSLVTCVVAGLSAGRAGAIVPPPSSTNVEQVLNISLTGSYMVTNANASTTIKTVAISSADVVKAIALDTNMFQGPLSASTNLSNGQLIHKILLQPAGPDVIVIRKGTNELDVTSFFGGSLGTNFWSSSDTNNSVKTSLESTAGNKTNVTDTLNSLSLNTTNLSFILTNGYGTAFYFARVFKVGTNLFTNGWANINCGGGATFSKNIAKVPLSITNSLNATNVAGPAQGNFSTTSGTVIVK